MNWIRSANEGCILQIKVVPRASKNEIRGLYGDTLKVRLQAPPVEGKANKALADFLAETLGCAPSSIEILAGESGRNKRVLIRGIRAIEAERKIKIFI